MTHIKNSLILECKNKLLTEKANLLNRYHQNRIEFQNRDDAGDEMDQSVRLLAEKSFVSTQDRIRKTLFEIESALERIQKNIYGFCEETSQPIEEDRLLAIPWTRLSIEGAELLESLSKRFVR